MKSIEIKQIENNTYNSACKYNLSNKSDMQCR